jgi:hypothetical protein
MAWHRLATSNTPSKSPCLPLCNPARNPASNTPSKRCRKDVERLNYATKPTDEMQTEWCAETGSDHGPINPSGAAL